MAHHSNEGFSGRTADVLRQMEVKGDDLLREALSLRDKLPPESRPGATGAFPQGQVDARGRG